VALTSPNKDGLEWFERWGLKGEASGEGGESPKKQEEHTTGDLRAGRKRRGKQSKKRGEIDGVAGVGGEWDLGRAVGLAEEEGHKRFTGFWETSCRSTLYEKTKADYLTRKPGPMLIPLKGTRKESQPKT